MMSSWNLCAVDTSKEFCRIQVIPVKHNELSQKNVLHFICVIVFPNMGIVGMKENMAKAILRINSNSLLARKLPIKQPELKTTF